MDGLDRQLHQWNEDIVEQEEEHNLAMLPMVDLNQVGNLAPADDLPLPFQPPRPPTPIADPPPLIYFHRLPNHPPLPHQDLEPIPPPQPMLANDDDDEDLPIYNFPPIPENVARAFARFDEDDDPVIEEDVIRKYTLIAFQNYCK